MLLPEDGLLHPAHVDVALAEHVHLQRRLVQQRVGHAQPRVGLHQQVRGQPRVGGGCGQVEGGASDLQS